jgi:hypothetical protein
MINKDNYIKYLCYVTVILLDFYCYWVSESFEAFIIPFLIGGFGGGLSYALIKRYF